MTTLMAFASKHGSTESIAMRIAQRLGDGEENVEVRRLDEVGSLDGYDRVVVGCPIYAGRWHRKGIRFLKRHEKALRQHADRLWFFTVGGAPDIAPVAASTIERYAPVEHAYLRGRLDHDQLGGLERLMLRATKARYGDFRDTEAIDALADRISAR